MKAMYSLAFFRICARLHLSPCRKQLVLRNFSHNHHFVQNYLESWDGVLQPTEAVLDVVPPLPLQLIVMGSLPVIRQLRREAEDIIFVLKQN